MCAIFGSFDASMFEILYEANKQRGTFASSAVGIAEDDQYIFKKEGSINFDTIEYCDETHYLTGHVQAPTSAKREWDYETSHPFGSPTWLVSHNGVLTNEQEIRKQYLPWLDNPVDTSVIVNLLQYFTDNDPGIPNAVKSIRKTLELIQGTFALCIVDSLTSDIYIARCGSTLFYDNKGNFSSTQGKGFKKVPEGVVYKLNKNTRRWNKSLEFNVESPFLFI